MIHIHLKDNTQKTRHSSKTRNYEQKGRKQEKGKEGKPLLITGKVTPSPSDIHCQDCDCCKAQNHLCHACLSNLRWSIEKESYNRGLKDVCNDKIKLGYFKTGYGQGIEKAIDITNDFDFTKFIHLVFYESLFNGYSKDEKEAGKIIKDNLLGKLNQETKE